MTIQEALNTTKPIKRPFMSDYLIEGELDKRLSLGQKKDRSYKCLIYKISKDPIILLIEDVVATDWEVLSGLE